MFPTEMLKIEESQFAMNKSNRRVSSVELLRLLLMFLIVLGHAYYHGLWGIERNGAAHAPWWSVFYSAMILWHVDCFVAISGWFGVKFSFVKFLKFYGVIFFWSAVNILWILMCEGHVSAKELNITGGWFGDSYLALMFVAPLLNLGIESAVTADEGSLKKKLLLMMVGLFIVWLPHRGGLAICPTGLTGPSFLTMLFVYSVVNIVRRLIFRPIGRGRLLRLMILYPVLVFGIGGFCVLCTTRLTMGPNWAYLNAGAQYFAPHVYLFAILMFLFFLWHVHVPAKWVPIIEFLSPSIFAVYLIHDTTRFGRATLCAIEKWLNVGCNLTPAIAILIAACLIFILCLVLDIMVRRPVAFFMKRVDVEYFRVLTKRAMRSICNFTEGEK